MMSFAQVKVADFDRDKFRVRKLVNEAYMLENGDSGVAFKIEGSLRLSDPESKAMEETYKDGRVLIVCNEDPSVEDLDAVIVYEFEENNIYFGPFAIAPHKKGTGLARHLISHIESIAKEKGVGMTELCVVNHRTELISMYSHMGFEIIEEKEVPYPHQEVLTRPSNFIRMKRQITSS